MFNKINNKVCIVSDARGSSNASYARGTEGTKDGFAMLIFVIVVAMSLLFMMIKYSENQKQIADNVREIVGFEKALQGIFLCAGHISNVLAKYSVISSDLIMDIKNLKINSLGDKNYWVKGDNKLGSQKRGEWFNCRVVDFKACDEGELCTFKAVIDGGNDVGGAYSKIYIEWKSEEYRSFISKLRLIRN